MTMPTDEDTHPPFWRSRHALGWLVLGAIATFFLVTRHFAHLLGALPYLLFLACPLMHLFMHHGHHGGRHHHAQPRTGDDEHEPR